MSELRLLAKVRFRCFMFPLNLSQCVQQLLFVVCVFYWLSSAHKNFVTSYLSYLPFILAATLVDNLRTFTLQLLSRNPTFYLQNEPIGNLVLREIIKFVATIMSDFKAKMHQIQRSPDPLAEFKESYF